MGVTTDPGDPRLTHGPDPADGPYRMQADIYLVLSEAGEFYWDPEPTLDPKVGT